MAVAAAAPTGAIAAWIGPRLSRHFIEVSAPATRSIAEKRSSVTHAAAISRWTCVASASVAGRSQSALT